MYFELSLRTFKNEEEKKKVEKNKAFKVNLIDFDL